MAWAIEDGAYTVIRIWHDSPLYRALFRRFEGKGRALMDVLSPAVIDELSDNLYVLALCSSKLCSALGGWVIRDIRSNGIPKAGRSLASSRRQDFSYYTLYVQTISGDSQD
ncbi:hypothetical protein A4U98_04660 [Bifidobacterium animalis subsp. animalis]|nr:hypothetical protein A4U98_04660 [Bifidobacterium animalis subsp. animalis]PHQ54829.1 hypothetical protein ADH71_003430 [Bifidobacterium animalis subsp. animalis]